MTDALATPQAAPAKPGIVPTFRAVLKKAIELQASDIHISAGGPYRVRIRDQIAPVTGVAPLGPDEVAAIVAEILTVAKKATPESAAALIADLQDLDCSYALSGVGRFRVNICSQRGSLAVVLRAIPDSIPSVTDLGLPKVVGDLALEDRGLVLVTGVTGSGKSTTLAAMVALINQRRAAKIVTIEDPIEFLHPDQRSIVVQRELGGDTRSFSSALRAALRQDPDVIMVGEMRDKETIDIVLKAAETGHLVLSTAHTTDAVKTISRLVSVFDSTEQTNIRLRLSESLLAVVSQRLLPRKEGKGQIPAVEVMRQTAAIQEYIADPGRTAEIRDLIAEGRTQYGMQTFDQHLNDLYHAGLISEETAVAAATSPGDFARNLQFQ
ncbi:MAG: PilT/PilU family type 4a pilus ATPase [Gemmatimonadales bacterium]